jgi:hypothetical protein
MWLLYSLNHPAWVMPNHPPMFYTGEQSNQQINVLRKRAFSEAKKDKKYVTGTRDGIC